VVGVTTSGGDGRRWWAARGAGAWHAVSGRPAERLVVSDRGYLDGGAYSLIPPLAALDAPRRRLVAGLDARASYVAPVEHGALMVADGRVEACVQLGGGPWDFAALAVIVEEAGGRFSDLGKRRDIYSGGPVVFSNGDAHDAVVAAMSA
jgi:histidinol-phosphatase